MSKKYKISDISTTLNVSIRTAQRYVENLINKENKEITFNEDVYNLIISRHNNDKITTDDDNDLIIEGFTAEEYEKFQRTLIEYPLIKEQLELSKNQIDHYRNAFNKQVEIHEKLLVILQSRNIIEYEEKKQ